MVQQGQIVARLAQPEVERSIAQGEARLRGLVDDHLAGCWRATAAPVGAR